MQSGDVNPNAFYLPAPEFWPFSMGSFVGKVSEGGACNVNHIRFNPHGNGTHTECVGHITPHLVSLQDCLKRFHFSAVLLSVQTEKRGADEIITLAALKTALGSRRPEAVVVRTLPNSTEKRLKQYSGTNPCYFEPAALAWLNEIGVLHLITDQPSVDREEDGGLLLAHHAFWGYPQSTRLEATITEMAFVPDEIKDGDYLLNLMIASFVNDASPSKPVLYPVLP
jgi:kynurenine formamidase